MKIRLAPLASDLTGSSKAITAVSRPGSNYVRRKSQKAAPSIGGRAAARAAFSNIQKLYTVAEPQFRAAWEEYPFERVTDARTDLLSQNLGDLTGAADMAAMVTTPVTRVFLEPTLISIFTAGARFTVTYTFPTPPGGWTFDRRMLSYWFDTDMSVKRDANYWDFRERDRGNFVASENSFNLNPGDRVRWCVYLRYLSPDGVRFFSASIGGIYTHP